ncbi:MAG: thioredoxin domain-containing protein [Propionibacteriaceae bacterium]|nr:thioredoxin domain-containing protein [Propionibacteriaceae bacterium]
MANNSNLSKRAALRQAQEMEERTKRNKRLMGFGFGLAGLIAVVVLGIVIFQAIGNRTTIAEEQLTPPNSTDGYGILLAGKAPTADKPHLIIWEDFQCPSCASAEATFGASIAELVDNGDITAEVRTATFMDRGREDGPSWRTAVAAAAAAEVGHYDEFHLLAYQNQNTGFTDQVLRKDLPEAAGITGDDLTRFAQLYNSRAFNDFVKNSSAKFAEDGIEATPAYIVSGKRLDLGSVNPAPEGFLAAVTEAWEAGGKKIEEFPEPYQR